MRRLVCHLTILVGWLLQWGAYTGSTNCILSHSSSTSLSLGHIAVSTMAILADPWSLQIVVQIWSTFVYIWIDESIWGIPIYQIGPFMQFTVFVLLNKRRIIACITLGTRFVYVLLIKSAAYFNVPHACRSVVSLRLLESLLYILLPSHSTIRSYALLEHLFRLSIMLRGCIRVRISALALSIRRVNLLKLFYIPWVFLGVHHRDVHIILAIRAAGTFSGTITCIIYISTYSGFKS